MCTLQEGWENKGVIQHPMTEQKGMHTKIELTVGFGVFGFSEFVEMGTVYNCAVLQGSPLVPLGERACW